QPMLHWFDRFEDRPESSTAPLRRIAYHRVSLRGRILSELVRGTHLCPISKVGRHDGKVRSVKLPVNPPLLPMLAKRISDLPSGLNWIFEPKWDGFRALVFRDGDEVLIQSRDEKSLNRYFPELLEPLRTQLPERCALDGEIVVARNGSLDFEALQLR